MKNDKIFIHIPKTGGTTINCAMHGTDWQTTPDFNYRHIIYETKRSNSKDIFQESNREKFSNFKIFMMLRDPADRLLSEYYFIRDRQEFMSNFKNKPKTFTDYIKNRQSQNYMTGFLVGKKMFDQNLVDESDFKNVIDAIDSLPIYVGLFEYFEESMTYFEQNIGVKWPKKIEAKRMTLNRISKEEITPEIKELIYENNKLDVQLYNHCKNKFQENEGDKLKKKVTFEKDRYNYVLKYTQRFPLIELYLSNKKFIKAQNKFFYALSIHLHKELKINDGRSFAATWNSSFINHVSKATPNIAFIETIQALKNTDQAPLDVTKELATILDDFLKTKGRGLINKALIFDEKNVEKVVIAQAKKTSGGLFSKIKNIFSK